MKKYVFGYIVCLPAFAIFADDVAVMFMGIAYLVFLLTMPALFPKTKRFWREWHRMNFRIISSFYNI